MATFLTRLVLLAALTAGIAGAAELASHGLVDVTAAPFHADATGEKDSTAALQKAIDHARKRRMVAFFPPGTYRITDTIECIQDRSYAESGPWDARRYWPVMLLGSRAGKTRPKIYLAPDSDGFGDPQQQKIAIYYHDGRHGAPPRFPAGAPGFINNKFVGIDIEIGERNPGAVAIRLRGAQGTVLEDSTIDVTHGHTGIEGASGSGGGYGNVTVIGGRIGFDGTASQPTPSLTGLTFLYQSELPILYRGRQTLNAHGIRIVTKKARVAVFAEDWWTSERTSADAGPGGQDQFAAWNGPICFTDGEIVFEGEPGTAFESNAGVYLNNVYVKNAKTLVDHAEGGRFAGRPGGWMRIGEYARGYTMRPFEGFQYTSPVYVDGKRQDGVAEAVASDAPPADLQARNIWSDDFPSFESRGAADVRDSRYGAKGDGLADDTAAIQKAINDNEIVYLPKGLYRVTRTIELKANTKLVGIAPHLSALAVIRPEGDFADPANPQPILRTPNDAGATNVISYVGTWPRGDGAYNLLWRSGRKSVIRDWIILHEGMHLPLRHNDAVVVTGNGGGRWYHYFDETWNREYAPAYRHLLVEGTTEPLRIYQCNPEHARSEANMEIRNAANVTLYGVKGEGNYPIVLIRNSRNIRLIGYGGNASPWPRTGLIVVDNSSDILLTSLFDTVRPARYLRGLEFFAGPGVDPDRWLAVVERFADGREFRTPPLERPVLHRRGTPVAVW